MHVAPAVSIPGGMGGVWIALPQTHHIEFLKAVNRALMERRGRKRLRFTDAERLQLAVLGKKLGRKESTEVATIATPDTILRWYRELVAKSTTAALVEGLGDRGRLQKSSGFSWRWRRGTRVGATRRCEAHSRTWAMRSVATRSRGS
jgi:hypothetical protein